MDFPWDAYAARIGLEGPVSRDEAGLEALHHAQFHAIAFENLDIHLGREIALDPKALVAKLVDRRRGGYCFELNGLLLLALRHLGFDARPLLARVHLHTPPSGRTHQLNAVTLADRTWLLDAGFGGGGPRRPLLLEDGWESHDGPWGFRIERRDPWGWLMSSREDGAWRESYSFDLGHVTAQDIAVANFFTSHSPLTHFTQVRVVSRPTAGGRISLRDQELTRAEGTVSDDQGAGPPVPRISRETIPPGEPTLEVLEREFGLRVEARFDQFRRPHDRDRAPRPLDAHGPGTSSRSPE